MNRTPTEAPDLPPADTALQHAGAPRPLPLFLELVRMVSERDPEMAREALKGLSLFERARRPAPRPLRPEIARLGSACLRDYGGSGPPAVLVPSLINPPSILDLDDQVSLAKSVAGMDRRVFLLDWGPASDRPLSIAGHVEELLVPLLHTLDRPPALVGYCLGGTMALAAADCVPVERIATLASPWRFAGYSQSARSSLQELWERAQGAARDLGALPMEVLQSAFWALDSGRTVAKFASFAALDPGSDGARRFVQLEDWANEGDPLPYPAARELLEDFFANDFPGTSRWKVGGRFIGQSPPCPALHFIAARDRITPAASAPAGESVQIASGHVGMVVGSARAALHARLADFLGTACR